MRLFAVFVVSLIFATPGLGQTVSNVSGELNHGATIQIFGNGFGVKSPPQPILWDDFEGATVGQTVPTSANIGVWNQERSAGVIAVDSGVYSGTKSAREQSSGSTSSGLCVNWNPTPSRQGYAGWKLKHEHSTGVKNNIDTKTFTLCAGPDTEKGFPMYRLGFRARTISSIESVFNFAASLACGPYSAGYITKPDLDLWLSTDVTWDFGVRGQSDSFGGRRWNGVLSSFSGREFQGDGCPPENPQFPENYTPYTGFRQAAFATYIAGQPSGEWLATWFDEVYVDSTMARVMISEKNTWNDLGDYAMQIPTYWSDGQISATVNTSRFLDEATVYLWVVNRDGQYTNPPFELVIGEGQAVELIGPPGTPAVSEIYD